jgi:hypothetical protein
VAEAEKLSEGVSSTNNTKGTNGIEDYLDVAIRPLTEFINVQEVYAHFETVMRKDGSLGPRLVYRLVEAELGVNYPPFLIYIPEDGFDYLARDIVVERMSDDELMSLRDPANTPREPFRDTLIVIALQNDCRLPEKEDKKREVPFFEIWWQVIESQIEQVNPFILRRGNQIVDVELRKVLGWNWQQFLDDLLFMGGLKDIRLVEAAKTYLMPQFSGMRRVNSVGIWMTNPSTGKSILSEKLGLIIVRTTQRSVTGGAKPDGSVVPSFLMSHSRLITVEQLEAVEIEALLAYMLTSLSGIESHVVVWQTPQAFLPFCPLVVTGNQNRERGQPNFEVFFDFIQGISKNYVALGRRVSVIIYGNDYLKCTSMDPLDSNPWFDNLWTIWREISIRILPLFREIYLDDRVQKWIYTHDPEYSADILSVFGEEEMMIKEFFIDHGKNGYPALKFRALSSAVVDHAQVLLGIALGEQSKGEAWGELVKTVLETAEETYAQLKTINRESIEQIAETEKLDVKILLDIYAALPRYLREFLLAVAYHVSTLDEDTTFSVDSLGETFDNIKGELDLYPGISIVKQALSGKSYNPRKHFARLSNFGISLRRQSESDIWIVTLQNPNKIEKWMQAVSTLSIVSTRYTLALKPTLRRALEIRSGEEQLKGNLTPSIYNEAKIRGLLWLKNPRNRDYEGWAVLTDFQGILSTAAGGRIEMGPKILKQMLDEKIVELHPLRFGLIRLVGGK